MLAIALAGAGLCGGTSVPAAQGAEDPYVRLRTPPTVDCDVVPAAEREKFPLCTFALPPARERFALSLDPAWRRLTETRLVDCQRIPSGERGKFLCDDEREAADLSVRDRALRHLADLTSTRDRLELRAQDLDLRHGRLADLRDRAPTVELVAELATLKEQKAAFDQVVARNEIVQAFLGALATVDAAVLDDIGRTEVAYARLRGDAMVFTGPAQADERIAALPGDTVVLRVGDRVRNARRLIFSHQLNFGYVASTQLRDLEP